ncbi:universal stress protein [Natronorubrum sulfidifaciens]|uniref:UspA domain protein n=1 Tax=Natronorubrum sulfidifaciens JCM 14089 TaxID=1230460 RepID=L9WF93_9EURY|nr:universal stress protein [Natronorubrum sulfidifaciens]ELY48129.1 UspA domain protein [Natronorubrum sulfidifaciens JCM 14089]
MATASEERPVLVAIANPEHAEQLARTAGDLARATDGVVQIVSVVVKSHESPFSVYTDDAILEQYSGDAQETLDRATSVAPDDVTVTGELVVGNSVSDGLLTAIERTDARALVIGWEERRGRTDAVLGTTVDRLLERAPCDLYVERIGSEANGVDSVLLPVAGGPHVRPAATIAKAIAARNDATVTIASVIGADVGTDVAQESAVDAQLALEETPGPSVDVEIRLHDVDDIVGALVDEAATHDVLVFGATRQGALHRRLVGSIPRTVVHRTDRTVIIARAGDAVGGPIYRQLRRLVKVP